MAQVLLDVTGPGGSKGDLRVSFFISLVVVGLERYAVLVDLVECHSDSVKYYEFCGFYCDV